MFEDTEECLESEVELLRMRDSEPSDIKLGSAKLETGIIVLCSVFSLFRTCEEVGRLLFDEVNHHGLYRDADTFCLTFVTVGGGGIKGEKIPFLQSTGIVDLLIVDCTESTDDKSESSCS